MTYNSRKVNLDINRKEVCDILLALSLAVDECGIDSKWAKLHDKIIGQLDAWDEKHKDLLNA